jgi:hypothetical protein
LRAGSRPLLAAILPALLLRALIPFGFMPVAGSGGPTMQLCPGAGVAGVVHHHHGGGGAADGSAHAVCAFAASAAPAVAANALPMPLQAADVSCARPQCVKSPPLPSILRTQSARAPPSLA